MTDVQKLLPTKNNERHIPIAKWGLAVLCLVVVISVCSALYLANDRLSTLIEEAKASRMQTNDRLLKLETEWDFVKRVFTAGTIKNSEDIVDLQHDRTDVMNAINGARKEVQDARVEQARENQILRNEVAAIRQDVAVLKSQMNKREQ